MNSTWFFICATKPEWSEVKKKLHFEKDHTFHGLNFFEAENKNKSIKLGQIGIGYDRAQQKAYTIFQSVVTKPQLVIHFGLSGGLDKSLKAGDIVVPTKFVNANGETATCPPLWPEKAENLLQSMGLECHSGTLLTSNKVLETLEEKKEAGEKFQAIAVDMETYFFAKMCMDKGIPFLSIRAIFDPFNMDLKNVPTETDFFDSEGNIKKSHLAHEIMTHPKLITSLPKFQKAASIGNKAIARFLVAAMETWE